MTREIAPFRDRAIGRRRLHGAKGCSPGEVVEIVQKEIHGQMVYVKILAPGCAQDPIDAQHIMTKRNPGALTQHGSDYNNEPVIPKNLNWKAKPVDAVIHRRNLKDKMSVLSNRRKRNLQNEEDL